jgi:putative methionine-R-sulfoxide reductase with GAF domain
LDHYSIIDQTASSKEEGVPASSVRFPGDDGGKSLAEMAERDLESTLQLLVERAQYITGASGAAIALLEDDEMICQASAGRSAPELGAEVQVKSGLTGESVRTRQVLRCDDAETDPRVNRESCSSLGIRSVMVMPLVRDAEVVGVFELMADRARAFEERDVSALERLAEMVLTSLEHADAAKRAAKEIATKTDEAKAEVKDAEAVPLEKATEEKVAEVVEATELAEGLAAPAIGQSEPSSLPSPTEKQTDKNEDEVPVVVESKLEGRQEAVNVRACQACGFPVSAGRTLCVDCEIARTSYDGPTASAQPPDFLSRFEDSGRKKSWLGTHIYTIGTVLIAGLTIALLVLRLK